MKLSDFIVVETIQTFRDRVEQILFNKWKQDPYLPPYENSPYEMVGDDYDDFHNAVDDIMLIAKKFRISDPNVAVEKYEKNLDINVMDMLRSRAHRAKPQ